LAESDPELEQQRVAHYSLAMPLAYKLLTVEEFLDSCPNDQRHYQLFAGVIVAMAPPAFPHQIIAAALTLEIGLAVRANLPRCSVHSQAGIAPHGVSGRDHFETDITVTCEPLSGSYRGIVAAPLLIVEVLSPSTDRDDVFVKLPAYQRIASLQEILYVETERVEATVYRRDGSTWTTITVTARDRLRLDTIGLDIALSDLYRGIPGLAP
jgi:Uma2 family endonuclease